MDERHLAKSAFVSDVAGRGFGPGGVALSVSVFGERGGKLRKSVGEYRGDGDCEMNVCMYVYVLLV